MFKETTLNPRPVIGMHPGRPPKPADDAERQQREIEDERIKDIGRGYRRQQVIEEVNRCHRALLAGLAALSEYNLTEDAKAQRREALWARYHSQIASVRSQVAEKLEDWNKQLDWELPRARLARWKALEGLTLDPAALEAIKANLKGMGAGQVLQLWRDAKAAGDTTLATAVAAFAPSLEFDEAGRMKALRERFNIQTPDAGGATTPAPDPTQRPPEIDQLLEESGRDFKEVRLYNDQTVWLADEVAWARDQLDPIAYARTLTERFDISQPDVKRGPVNEVLGLGVGEPKPSDFYGYELQQARAFIDAQGGQPNPEA